MKKVKLWKASLGTICVVSLALSIYAALSILLVDKRMEQSMNQLESILNNKNQYNAEIDTTPTSEEKRTLYTNRPTKGDAFGKLVIPSINLQAPIIEGTEEKQLSRGVGHYLGSVLPGENDNTVIAAHRDTIFQRLGEVRIGDQLNIETVAGTFTYKIINQKIVDASDRTVIVPSEKAIITVVTCYPFHYIGPAPQRYILTGELIQIEKST